MISRILIAIVLFQNFSLHAGNHLNETLIIPKSGAKKIRNPFQPSKKNKEKDGIIQGSTNERISLDFQDIKVRDLLQLIADFSRINMVVSDSVQGTISLKLHDIHWQEALSIILATRSLDKRKLSHAILIAPSAEIAAHKKSEISLQQQAQNLAPLSSQLLQINYAKAGDIAVLLRDKANVFLSKRGNLIVDPRTNTIWIRDTNNKIHAVQSLVKQLDIPVKQVLIEARIVNASKDFAKDLGVRFGVSNARNHISGTLKGANHFAQKSVSADAVPILDRLNVDLIPLPTAASPATVGIALAKLGSGIMLDLELAALESEGRGEIIASPRLIATNQQPAVIESGEEIPYQEATPSGAAAVAFRKAVLSLKVIPQITPDSNLLMELQINQDTAGPRTFQGVPVILTKSIRTNVLVKNGQTIVLGGIYKQDKNNAINRVPFLGEIPLIGNLFRQRLTMIRNEELLIFITPRIISSILPTKASK